MNIVINSKENILTASFKIMEAVGLFIERIPQEQFNNPLADGKWSSAQHLDHLLKSTSPLNRGLDLPKENLIGLFGNPQHASRSYNQIHSIYKQKLKDGLTASAAFTPANINNFGKEHMLNNWNLCFHQYLDIIRDKWKDDELDKYQIAHPALKELTVREMLFFTEFHTKHHYEIMLRV